MQAKHVQIMRFCCLTGCVVKYQARNCSVRLIFSVVVLLSPFRHKIGLRKFDVLSQPCSTLILMLLCRASVRTNRIASTPLLSTYNYIISHLLIFVNYVCASVMIDPSLMVRLY